MEVVSCAASVSQLLVYIASSSRSLERLYTELKSGYSTYHEEESNISLLLNILQRLSRRSIADESPILPVLIAISGIACQALYLLQPNKILGINWTPITAHERINSAFQSLDKKRTLLHLYLSQAHHDALVDLRETIKVSNMSSSIAPLEDTTESASKNEASNCSMATGATREQPRGFRVIISLCCSTRGFANNQAV